MFALGSNLEAARFSGVPVNRLRVISHVICAVMTTLAGLLEAGSIGSVSPSTAGVSYEMYAITAAVLGGCALRGGKVRSFHDFFLDPSLVARDYTAQSCRINC